MAKPTVVVVSSHIDLEGAPKLLQDVLDAAAWDTEPQRPEDNGLIVTRDPLGLPHWLIAERRYPDEGGDDGVAFIGQRPAIEFLLAAQTSDERAHRSLGALALALAEACSGWIDLNGPLGYPDTIDAAEKYLQSLDLGQGAHLIRYGTTSKTPWVYVLMDPAAFRMWIDHEEFHLIC